MTNPKSTVLLTSEVSRLLGVSSETVRLWERAGKLRAIRTGTGVRLFDRDHVEQLARARGLRPPPSAGAAA